MNDIVEIVDSIEIKIKKLLLKQKFLEQKNNDLSQELKKSSVTIQNQIDQIEQLKGQIDTLKISNSLLGSKENTRDTKLKINSLIREIDYCIEQLAD